MAAKMPRTRKPSFPDARFEAALRKSFGGRKDMQDFARLIYYGDFEPEVDSYERISNTEIDRLRLFVGKHRNRST